MKRFLAIANLGVHFGLHCLRQLWFLAAGRPDGLARFLAHYAADGLRAVSPADQAAQAAAARCLTCGACSFALAAAGRLPPTLDLPPSALATTLPRCFPYFPSAAETARAFADVAPDAYSCPACVDLAAARALLLPANPAGTPSEPTT